RHWRRRCSCCAATVQVTSPDRFLGSMAASTPPASVCRRCAASDGTGSIPSPSPSLWRGDEEKLTILAETLGHASQLPSRLSSGQREFGHADRLRQNNPVRN